MIGEEQLSPEAQAQLQQMQMLVQMQQQAAVEASTLR